MLFPAPENGWDIVIGNPPYQTPDDEDRERGHRLHYAGASADLYLMFIEAALEVTGAGSCISLIVPHSIVFRRQLAYQNVRRLIESASARIDIRTYDNRPLSAFPDLPWLKTGQATDNRQRVTILTFLKKSKETASRKAVDIYSRGLIRLNTTQRREILQAAGQGFIQPKFPESTRVFCQWTQAPTESLAKLLNAMWSPILQKGGGPIVTFPRTGMYFLTCLPDGLIDNRRRRAYSLPDDLLLPWIGLYNSHLFHAYWLMIGDAFDLTAREFATVRRPPGWNNPELRRKIELVARELISDDNLKKCEKVHTGQGGKKWPNFDFHSRCPELIAELDRLLLRAYGLEEIPLIEQMRIIRAGSAHELNLAGGTLGTR